MTVQVSLLSVPGSHERPNEDFAVATPSLGCVLDGLSAPADLGTGCIHSTAWYSAALGARLVHEATTAPQAQLTTITAAAIRSVSSLHGHTCDLTHPGTPSASIAMVRTHDGWLEYLVLFDSVILLERRDGTIDAITDARVDRFARDEHRATLKHSIGSSDHKKAVSALVAAQRHYRNKPGGYWVAGAIPSAASQAITGRQALTGLRSVAILSDGVGCLVDAYQLQTWRGLVDLLDTAGPAEVVRQVRVAEAGDPKGVRWPRYKASDDASIVYMRLSSTAHKG